MNKPDKHIELLANCAQLFMKYGIKSLTMDDIANHLGISKKTLYLYVSDKKDLVKQVVELEIEHEECMLDEIVNKEGNAIEELLRINQKVSEKLQNIQPSVMYDLQKYYPEAWKIFEEHKCSHIPSIVEANIEKGKEEGFYRDNVNAKIISKLYVLMVDNMFNSDIFPPFENSYKQLHLEIARYHIRGIASRKGIDYLKEILSQTQQDF
ncbi:MAG TPA: TetR/AcrR family transcriptional regulator [Vicingaceae bacterium]|nr:TetR/AcrR family transcriptional regulator [Vicingaceae bacterium]